MKKSIISLVLALVMVFSLVLVAAPQAQATTHADHCVCGGAANGMKDHTCANVTGWTALTAGGELDSGNYYLSADLTLTESITVKAEATVTICLNGFTLDGGTNRAINLGNTKVTLNICDCSTAKSGAIKSEYAGGSGAIIYMNNTAQTVSIFGGTLTAPTENVGAAGAVIRNVKSSSTLKMYGGVIQNGKGTNGGNIANYGIFYLYGGVIKNGEGTNKGGNIFTNKEMHVYGGAVINGDHLLGKDIWEGTAGKLYIYNMDESSELYNEAGTEAANIIYADAHASLSFNAAADGKKITVTKDKNYVEPTPPVNNPTTGDSANLVVMGLGLVLGVAGMACLLPKKQTV